VTRCIAVVLGMAVIGAILVAVVTTVPLLVALVLLMA
jgi:hypothetical protein